MKKKLKDFFVEGEVQTFLYPKQQIRVESLECKKAKLQNTAWLSGRSLFFFFPKQVFFCLQKERERITALSEIHLNAGMSKKELIPKLKRSSLFFPLCKSRLLSIGIKYICCAHLGIRDYPSQNLGSIFFLFIFFL